MTALKRLAAAYMLLLAAVVAVHFLVNQFYDPMLEGTALTVWRILDPLMMAGVVMALIVAFGRKRRRDAEPPLNRSTGSTWRRTSPSTIRRRFSSGFYGTGSASSGLTPATTSGCYGR